MTSSRRGGQRAKSRTLSAASLPLATPCALSRCAPNHLSHSALQLWHRDAGHTISACETDAHASASTVSLEGEWIRTCCVPKEAGNGLVHNERIWDRLSGQARKPKAHARSEQMACRGGGGATTGTRRTAGMERANTKRCACGPACRRGWRALAHMAQTVSKQSSSERLSTAEGYARMLAPRATGAGHAATSVRRARRDDADARAFLRSGLPCGVARRSE
eukprot:3485877-Pleurochrysis_carterae.AAC.2